MKNSMKKMLSLVLSIAIVFSIIPNMGAIVFADQSKTAMVEEEKTIKGTVNIELEADQTFAIKLSGDEFKSSNSSTDIKSWITSGSLPEGLTATADIDQTTAKVTITGFPKEAKSTTLNMTIPSEALKSGKELPVTGPSIEIKVEELKVTSEGVVEGRKNSALAPNTGFTVILQGGAKFKDSVANTKNDWNIEPNLGLEIQSITRQTDLNKVKIVLGGTPKYPAKNPIHFTIPAEAIEKYSGNRIEFKEDNGAKFNIEEPEKLTVENIITSPEGEEIIATFSKKIDSYTVKPDLFKFTIKGQEREFDKATPKNGSQIYLKIKGEPIKSDDEEIKLKYTKKPGMGIKSTDGRDLEDIDKEVKNEVKLPGNFKITLTINKSDLVGGGLGFGKHNFGYSDIPAKTITVKNIGIKDTGELTVSLSDGGKYFTADKYTIPSLAPQGTVQINIKPKSGLKSNSSNYNTTVKVTGKNRISATMPVSIKIDQKNKSIIDLGITPVDVKKSKISTSGTTVAKLQVEGNSIGNVTYEMKNDDVTGNDHNNKFQINGDELQIKDGTTLEKREYKIHISASDSENMYHKALSFTPIIKPDTNNGGSNNGGSNNGGSNNDSSSNDSSSTGTPGSVGRTTNTQKKPEIVKPNTNVSGDTAKAKVNLKAVEDSIKKNKQIANNGLDIKVESKEKVKDVELSLSQVVLNAIVNAKAKEVRIATPVGDVKFDLAAIEQIQSQAKNDIELSIKKKEDIKLTDEISVVVGNRPIYDLSIKAGKDTNISSFGAGQAEVRIPYVLASGERAERLTVYYLSENKMPIEVPGARYDANTKAMVFTTGHFSLYAVGQKPELESVMTFKDINGHWAKLNIDYVVSKGLMNGVSKEMFTPDASITRGMFVTVIGRMAKIDTKDYTGNKFADVDSSMYYAPYIEWALQKSIIKGVSELDFMPDSPVTREQMAVIIQGYAKATNIKLSRKQAEKAFEDHAMISTWASDAVKTMHGAGILSGKGGNIFDPKGTATRAEAAKVIHTLLEGK